MNKIILLALTLVIFSSCNQRAGGNHSSEALTAEVVVYYFHGPQRCKSCLAIEEAARKAIAENFNNPEKVQFVEVNLDDKNFEEQIEKYEVAWSSLIIEKGVLYTNMTEKGFAMALSDPEGLQQAITTEINRYLAG